jgi:glutaredoxin
MQNFTIYSRDGCPYCVKIKEVMNLAKLNHVVYNLDEHFDREAFYGQFGKGSTFPQVVMNGDNLGGCTETVKYLQENSII